MTFEKILERYRKFATSESDKGTKFERLMKNFLLTYQVYSGVFEKVWLWKDFPYRAELGGKDLGIDIVTQTFNGEFWAVQCKCYAETTQINKPAVDSFLATSSKIFDGDKKFAHRLWISTTNNWNNEAEITLKNQVPPVSRIGLNDLENAAIDWEKLDAGITGDKAILKTRQPLQHQLDAINSAQEYFQTHERGKLIMACGTGKTFTSLKIAEKLFPHGKILFLVPSISLLSQTLSEWSNFAEMPLDSICVCSDETASRGRTEDSTSNIDLALPATTDIEEIARRLKYQNHKSGLKVVFSTYQSLKQVAEAQKKFDGNFVFDLIICDEAHRTTGYGTDATPFTAVHDNNFIAAKKRMYMTATPRLYTSDAKKKAVDKDLMLWSMDDDEIYGKEFFHIKFGEAIEKNLLSDYKVIVFAVTENDIPAELQNVIATDSEIKLEDVSKLIGCTNALAKKMIYNSKSLAEVDPAPMKKAVAFCSKISKSKSVATAFNELQKAGFKVEAAHVDGSFSATERNLKLSWLKNADETNCKILTNARCLSEGVDVPTLDAVLFLSPRKSKVDIVQAVGRVMRKAAGKKYGYIIIPVVIPIDKNPEDVLAESPDFGTVWDILNALRAHDERMDIFIQKISLNRNKGIVGGVEGGDDHIFIQGTFNFGELEKVIYARMVERVGNRRYWEQWAKDIAEIAARHKEKILQLTGTKEFRNFILDLRENINPTISEKDAVEMLAQHLISRPVFDALFENYSFAQNNAVSKSMQQILEILDTGDNDNAQLEKFYKSVKDRCSVAKTAEDKQKIIIELYDKFFKIALPKEVEKLGIVYTPVEVVDFILRSVNDVLKKNFGKSISDKNVHILDPFTGTGTFITRLIQSGLIRPKDLLRKYQNELHANEIVLLAYYIAAINIENAFHDSAQVDNYLPFGGICLTDTFEMYERTFDDVETFNFALKENSKRVKDQRNTEIKVIVGNPPYSVGQKSANDNAQNNYYAKLEGRIQNTYAAGTKATNKNSLYDSYIKAFRWASDRIGDSGIIAFVSNAGWLDGASMDGLRNCFAKEFSSIYVFNLRGNQRTQGEISRKEGGKIFGSGSRAPIAITILVKNPSAQNIKADIFYCDIGDYLSREEKLAKIEKLHSVLTDDFKQIEPNEKGDWINQRGDAFEKFILLGDKKNHSEQTFFCEYYSNGLKTQRDVWCYNFSKNVLSKNIQTTIDFYNSNTPENRDSTKFLWSDLMIQNKRRGIQYKFDVNKILESIYRPFCSLHLYRDNNLNDRPSQFPKLFPNSNNKNILICVSGIGGEKDLSVYITDKIIDLNALQAGTQCFPLCWYEEKSSGMDNLFEEMKEYERRDGVTDFILTQARLLYGDSVTKEDIFYYVYGFLHLPAYRETFAADLKKSLPRIFLVNEPRKFWQLSKAGRKLADIHLNYEKQPPADVEVVITAENYSVDKLKLSADKKNLIYNADIAIKNIPARAFEYVVNGRSPLEWIIDRYQVKKDSASGIVNNPNDWAQEHNKPRYILDLILSSITVSLKTLDIVDNLPNVSFE